MTGIIGAGFGLYGYFPAVVKTEGKAVLLNEAKSIFETRPELQKYKENILWSDNIDSLLPLVDNLIVSVPPKIQEEYFNKIISAENISKIILEKPLASTPETSQIFLSNLSDSKKSFRIGYTFLYTNWFGNFEKEIIENTNIEIIWTFKAHHYKHNVENWKRYNSEGGGVIRFFGIHLFPLLINFGFNEVVSSETSGANSNDLEKWTSVFKNQNGFVCKLSVNSNLEKEVFSIKAENKQNKIIDFVSPFETANDAIQNEDNRVVILERLLKSLNDENQNSSMSSLYKNSNELWLKTEMINKFTEL